MTFFCHVLLFHFLCVCVVKRKDRVGKNVAEQLKLSSLRKVECLLMSANLTLLQFLRLYLFPLL